MNATAPDTYPADWPAIAQRIKDAAGWVTDTNV